MSIITCHDCCRYVDTDFHPVEWIEIGNMRRMTETVAVCESCFEKMLCDMELAGNQEGLAMERADKEGPLK